MSQSGQATFEYLLLLVVAVAIVIAFSTAFIRPFGAFVEGYMGDYLECLLETGELPSSGYQAAGQQQGESCNESFEPFTLADGRSPTGDPDGDNDTGDDTGSDSDSGDDSGSTEGDGSGEGAGDQNATGSEGGGGGGGAGGGGSIRPGNRGFSEASNGSGNQNGAGSADKIPASESLLAGGGARGDNNNSEFGGSGRDSYRAITGRLPAKVKIPEKEAAPKVVAPAELKAAAGGGLNEPKKIVMKRTESSKTDLGDDEGFSFGGFIRMILIAGIVIAILVFIGMQLMQITRGME